MASKETSMLCWRRNRNGHATKAGSMDICTMDHPNNDAPSQIPPQVYHHTQIDGKDILFGCILAKKGRFQLEVVVATMSCQTRQGLRTLKVSQLPCLYHKLEH